MVRKEAQEREYVRIVENSGELTLPVSSNRILANGESKATDSAFERGRDVLKFSRNPADLATAHRDVANDCRFLSGGFTSFSRKCGILSLEVQNSSGSRIFYIECLQCWIGGGQKVVCRDLQIPSFTKHKNAISELIIENHLQICRLPTLEVSTLKNAGALQ